MSTQDDDVLKVRPSWTPLLFTMIPGSALIHIPPTPGQLKFGDINGAMSLLGEGLLRAVKVEGQSWEVAGRLLGANRELWWQS